MNEEWVNDWYLLGTTAEVAHGTVGRRTVDGLNLAVFRARGEYFAARDGCGDCSQSLAGGAVGDEVVECPECGRRLRFSHDAGAPADAGDDRLSTFPVMVVNDELFAWIEGLG